MQGLTISRAVWYRSRTGDYTCPAVVTATIKSLSPKGVELGHVPPLSSDTHVHLTVFTPGKPGMRRGAQNFLVESQQPRSENIAGCYQEWDIPFWDWLELYDGPSVEADPTAYMKWQPSEDNVLALQPAGTWTWPPRA